MFTKDNIGVRFEKNNHFNLDCQFVINTPTSGDTSVIEPHLDNPVEFYAALLYMKDLDDDSKVETLPLMILKISQVFMENLESEKKR